MPLTSMIHMWRSLWRSMAGRPLPMSILGQAGMREETESEFSGPGHLHSGRQARTVPTCRSPKHCHPRACLSLGGPYWYTNASKPGQLLQTLAQRLCKQGPGLLSAIVLLKQGQALWAGMGFEHRDLCKQGVRNRLCRQTRSAARDSHGRQ